MSMFSHLFSPVTSVFSTEVTISFLFLCVMMWLFSNYFLVIWINVLQYTFERKEATDKAERLIETYYTFPSLDSNKPTVQYLIDVAIIIFLMPATFCLIVQRKMVENRVENKEKTREEHIPELEKL